MATINPFIPSPALLRRRPRRVTGGIFAKVVLALRQSWRAYVRYKRLSVLSDQALAARGLTRRDIGRHAFFDHRD
ncbi:MAG: hypothetical protein R3F54_14570 [Alphaproteobacteria bacterium]